MLHNSAGQAPGPSNCPITLLPELIKGEPEEPGSGIEWPFSVGSNPVCQKNSLDAPRQEELVGAALYVDIFFKSPLG